MALLGLFESYLLKFVSILDALEGLSYLLKFVSIFDELEDLSYLAKYSLTDFLLLSGVSYFFE